MPFSFLGIKITGKYYIRTQVSVCTYGKKKARATWLFGLYEGDKVCKMEWSLRQRRCMQRTHEPPRGAGRKDHYGNQNYFQ